jgi:hypothetical protein
MRNRIKNILIALDIFIYALITLGYGSPSETLSSAAWRMEAKGKLTGKIFRPIIDYIFRLLGDDNHCFESFQAVLFGHYLPEEMRKTNRQ